MGNRKLWILAALGALFLGGCVVYDPYDGYGRHYRDGRGYYGERYNDRREYRDRDYRDYRDYRDDRRWRD